MKSNKSETKFMFIGLLILCLAMGYLSAQNQKKRSNLEEVKKLPFHNVELETVEDGIYEGSTATSFLYVVLEVDVKDHVIQNINLSRISGKKINHVEEIIKRMVENNTIKIELKHNQELETLVLMSCVDNALYSPEEEVLTNAEN